MVERKRILVGADASDHGTEAIRQGDVWARAHGWQLLVCHVAPAPLGVHMLFPQQTEQDVLAQPELELRLERALREHVGELTGRPPDETNIIIARGAPDGALVREAEARSVHLLVVGSHSHSGLEHIFLGNIAERVLRHAHCSVLVVRPHPTTRRILVATDFSSDATAGLAIAVDHARTTGASLAIACSVERQLELAWEMTSFGSAYGFVRHEYEDLRRAAERRLAEALESLGARGEKLVLDGKPAAAVVEAAGRTDADLVVVGASGTSRLKRMLLGGVAEKVVRATPCSVLVARAAQSS